MIIKSENILYLKYTFITGYLFFNAIALPYVINSDLTVKLIILIEFSIVGGFLIKFLSNLHNVTIQDGYIYYRSKVFSLSEVISFNPGKTFFYIYFKNGEYVKFILKSKKEKTLIKLFSEN